MSFSAKKKTYPNNDKYYELNVNGQIVGLATEVDGGYLAQRRRKPVPSLKDAARQCIESRMSDCLKKYKRWEALHKQLLEESV